MIDELSDRGIKRWSTEFAEMGQGQRGPRLFDGVRQAVTYSHDYTPLDHFSSFELIRKDSMRAEAERNSKLLQEEQKSLRANQKLSHEMSQESGGMSSPTKHDPNASVQSMGSSRSSSRMQSGSKNQVARDITLTMPQGGTPAPKISLDHLDLKPKGDDLSMLERLDIIRTGRRESKPTTPRTPPEKPSELRRRKSATRDREGSKRTESESGGPPSKSTKETAQPEEQRVMVRAGGFQWIDRMAKGDVLSQVTEEMQQTPVTDASRVSLRNNSTTRKSHGRDSPSRAGSRKGYTPSQTPRVDQQ